MADQAPPIHAVAVSDPNSPQKFTVSSWSNAVAVTKSDSVVYDPTIKAIWVGGVGNVAVRMKGGQSVTFTAVPAGTLLPVEVDMVLSTGTTATLLIGLY